ncbi:hypothetical protein [Idiomarina aminovorans]|uniref:hypothetical protein n=1 Tax=Idiomarina aminovorans TaxID=2914829 RepID=UPI002002CBCE|nr:hypothetical protein [Idiomarina sp. ATCH4]MCK7459579.1 hypothetical protein [Idiomarina sp. ATCH4]
MARDIKFKLTVDTDEYKTDMGSTSLALKGVSDTFEITTEALADDRVRQVKTQTSSASAWLESSFDSSYGLNFKVTLTDEAEASLRGIHDSVISEFISYITADILNLEQKELSDEAAELIASHNDIEESLKSRLWQPVKNMHAVTQKTGKVLKLYRTLQGNRKEEISQITEETYRYLTEKRVERNPEHLVVAVTRFNSLTGNGRLIIGDDRVTVAFSIPKSNHDDDVEFQAKVISQNLLDNTDVSADEREFLNVTGRRVKLNDGRTVKIYIDSVEDE